MIQAQEQTPESKNKKLAIIHLDKGAQLEVSIIDWDLEKGITAITMWGQEMFFPKDRITKVISYSNEIKSSPYIFREKGIYYALSGGIITGNPGTRQNEEKGYTLSASTGYRFNRLFSLGIGTGVDQFIYGSGERTHPIFLDFRSFLFPNNTTLMLNIQTGYSLAFANENKSLIDAKGGFMFYPNLGLSFGGSETKYSIDIGYKFQRATWTYASPWDLRNQTELRLGYRRFVLRFGIVL